ncbi:hypothetical protein B0H14DRAFT_3727616 [Mycena olivaceomarginata]|nr:hypothetical protein B0H14DRAFT_3727616 [Mycena olivaceomarginata]
MEKSLHPSCNARLHNHLHVSPEMIGYACVQGTMLGTKEWVPRDGSYDYTKVFDRIVALFAIPDDPWAKETLEWYQRDKEDVLAQRAALTPIAFRFTNAVNDFKSSINISVSAFTHWPLVWFVQALSTLVGAYGYSKGLGTSSESWHTFRDVISDHRETSKHPLKVLALRTVRQVDILGDDQLLVMLSGHQVLTLPLSALDHIAPHCRTQVRAFRLSTTVKVLELVGRELRIFREFYIPLEVTSVNYLKTRLCIGHPTGFEIVDLESLEMQALLDHADDSFTQTLKPGTGCRTKKEFLVCWDGTPTGFALHPPYVLAFTSSCVEVWHIETGTQVQVIPGVNVRLLCKGTQLSNIAEKYTDGATLEEVLMVSGDSVLVLRSVSDNV